MFIQAQKNLYWAQLSMCNANRVSVGTTCTYINVCSHSSNDSSVESVIVSLITLCMLKIILYHWESCNFFFISTMAASSLQPMILRVVETARKLKLSWSETTQWSEWTRISMKPYGSRVPQVKKARTKYSFSLPASLTSGVHQQVWGLPPRQVPTTLQPQVQ